jgi:hypothetical protein
MDHRALLAVPQKTYRGRICPPRDRIAAASAGCRTAYGAANAAVAPVLDPSIPTLMLQRVANRSARERMKPETLSLADLEREL